MSNLVEVAFISFKVALDFGDGVVDLDARLVLFRLPLQIHYDIQ